MDAQAVFNTVCDHLMKQGRRSATNWGRLPFCRYRAEDPDTGETLKCAAGVLIPDDVYSEEMESKSWRHIMNVHKWRDRLHELHEHEELIRCLQRVHDRDLPVSWARILTGVARDFGLKVPESVRAMKT